jgi:hypothetical protein
LKDIRSRVFFKILDEAAIAAGKNCHAKTFNLAASVADLNQRLAGDLHRAHARGAEVDCAGEHEVAKGGPSLFGFDSQIRSKIAAMPWPPPMHIVTSA